MCGGGGSVILGDHYTLVIALLPAGAVLVPANVTSTAFPVQMETDHGTVSWPQAALLRKGSMHG